MGLLDRIAPLDEDGRPAENFTMLARLALDPKFRKAEAEATRRFLSGEEED